MIIVYAFAAAFLLLITACTADEPGAKLNTPTPPTEEEKSQEIHRFSARTNRLLDGFYIAQNERRPSQQAKFGLQNDQTRLDNLSEAHAKLSLQLTQAQLLSLKAIDQTTLNAQTQLNLGLFIRELENAITDFKWRFHAYLINPVDGLHRAAVDMMINRHTIHTSSDAKAYIQRLNAIPLYLEQLSIALTTRADKGIVAPTFVFPKALATCKNIIDSQVLLLDFKEKLKNSDIDRAVQAAFMLDANSAFHQQTKPAYQKFMRYLQHLSTRAEERPGVLNLPEGKAYYQYRLSRSSTTQLKADEIYALGEQEVARLLNELKTVQAQLGYTGDLHSFFEFLQTDTRFFFANTEAGRQQYLYDAQRTIRNVSAKLNELFYPQDLTHLVVESSQHIQRYLAGDIFYQRTGEGQQDARLFLNLREMQNLPIYQMAARVYHEAIPGHHLQLSKNQDQPMFRQASQVDVYTEGWGLYAEWLPTTIGLYQDPYDNVGRLSLALSRAARLVVDTGLHSQHWSREKAIRYLTQNTPHSHLEATHIVEQVIVQPTQTTAQTLAFMKLKALQAAAREHLGSAFDIREFHEVILRQGALPLDTLEQQVATWIKQLKPL